VEDGAIVLVGATTENPSFELNGALLSCCRVFILKRLDTGALDSLIARAERLTGREMPLDDVARRSLAAMADSGSEDQLRSGPGCTARAATNARGACRTDGRHLAQSARRTQSLTSGRAERAA
jgi:putative ATPase